MDDRELVSRLAAGDRAAWDELLRRYGGYVRAEARRQLLRYRGRADAADVEDAAQEVLSLLLEGDARALRSFRGDCALTTWLFHVVRSVCRQIAGRSRSPAPARPLAFEPPEAGPSSEAVAAALSRLPPRDQRLLRLFFYEGKKYREIAAEVGVSVNSVGPLLARALDAFASAMK
jgi:RNA polymerase sigma-70 factor (ECF subfamily)